MPRGGSTAVQTLLEGQEAASTFLLGLVEDRSATASGTLVMGLEGWRDIPCRNQGRNSIVHLWHNESPSWGELQCLWGRDWRREIWKDWLGPKGGTMDAKLILPHSTGIEIFCLSAKTTNSLWASISSFNPSLPRATATVVVLNKFLSKV